MFTKEVTFSPQARQKLYQGVRTLAKAVGSTLGPEGSTVLIDTSYPIPTITKDGITVAKNIFLQDPIENMGAQIVKQAAAQTALHAGDGTTTATILAEALVRYGLQAIDSGHSPIQIKETLESLLPLAVERLKSWATPVDSIETLRSVATISANNDPAIGAMIASAYEAIGYHGVIAVKESKTSESYITQVKGMEFDRGLLSPYFINNPSKLTCEFDDPFILLVDGKLRDVRDLAPILDKVHAKNSPLLIIASEVEAQALNILVYNAMKAGLKACAVKAPAFADRQKQILQDIAALTGGTVFSEDTGTLLKDCTLEMLGRSKSSAVSAMSTMIVEGYGSKEAVAQRLELINAQLSNSTSEWESEKLRERIAKLTDGVAILHVGAATESELKEKKDRIDDALRATRAAIEEGVLPGGAIPLYLISSMFSTDTFGVWSEALKEPFNVLCQNAGADPDQVMGRIKQASPEPDPHVGYDAKYDKVVNLIEANIIDPLKVVRVALENAISVANLILMTSTTIHPINEKIDLSHAPGVDPSYYDQP